MIEGRERTINSVFGTERRYRIPDYQRPYAWGEDHAEKLFEDLCEAFSESAADYFLGSLVLVKTSETDFEVVDGQQRLCTLAILLSALIHSLPPDKKGDYETLLNDKTSRRAAAPRAPRITARDNDRDSLDLVQTFKLDELPKADNGNRIARSLAPPIGRVNSAAQNYKFDRKKREYFTSKHGTSSFALTTQVLNESKWTPAVVERRQEKLIAILKDKWDLGE